MMENENWQKIQMTLDLEYWNKMVERMKKYEDIVIDFPQRGVTVTLKCDLV